ncbi:MAG: DUF2220 family protein [Pseudomonadota bacterium]|nr:DUF2220 family protein [Pseudomonadota bacterium]
MRTPEALLQRLRSAWRRNRADWLAGQGNWPLALKIDMPTEAQAQAQWTVFDGWLRQWQQVGQGRVVVAERRWARLGTQILPTHWCFDDAHAVADALGEGPRWQRAARRHGQWLVRFDAGSARPAFSRVLARNFERLADTEDAQWRRLEQVLDWLLQHPSSGLYLRQLPIAGIDSKWIEPWRGIVADLLQALGRTPDASGFHAVTGLRPPPERLRLRILDAELRRQVGGLGDVTAPLEQLAALRLRPGRVLVVENRDTGLALGELPGTVAFMALGYAVDQLARIPWLADVPMAYWGDIDSHGLAILDRLRHHLPQACSLMMDERTLLAHLPLCVRELRPLRASLTHLDAQEAALYAALQDGRHGADLRLEQERLPWDWAWQQVLAWAVHD